MRSRNASAWARCASGARQAIVGAIVIALFGCCTTFVVAQDDLPDAADAIHIESQRKLLIFAPGEQLTFELKLALAEAVPGTTIDLHTTLSPAHDDETLWNIDERLDVPVAGAAKATINVPLPREEGVYTVRVAATRPSGFRERFFPGAASSLAERSFEIVVLDSRPPREAQPGKWETVLEIDPSNPRWWDRLPNWTQLRRIPGLNRGPLGSIRAGTASLPLGRFVELPPTVADAEPHWQAYSLPLEASGVPHLLEIEYPADAQQQFGISIVEPSAGGLIQGDIRDSGVYVEGFGRTQEKGKQTHRVVFWPRTQAPLLLITNAHPSAAAHFGHIRVLKRSSGHLTSNDPPVWHGDRLVAAYLSRPNLDEAFGANNGSNLSQGVGDAPSPQEWLTLYESTTRLADYLRYGGFNSAVLATADGVPSRAGSELTDAILGEANHASREISAQDEWELRFRVFDREGLALVPALRFSTPIPALERHRRAADPQTSGLEWIGPDGKTYVPINETAAVTSPHYNLLNPRVQQAILQVVSDFVERNDKHPSLAGVAIQLSSDGYAQLPPLDWGFDDATIRQFESDTNIKLTAIGANRFAERHSILTGVHAEIWRNWRAARVSEFYEQLATIVRKTNSKRRILITCEDSFASPQLAARIRPNLLADNRIESTLADLGIQRATLEKIPGVVICPPRFVGSMTPLAVRGVDLESNHAAATWNRTLDSNGSPAALLYHRPRHRQFASFAAKSPFEVADQLNIVSQPLAHGWAVRQPYAEAILQSDPVALLDGGELLPLGQEDELRQARFLLTQLPTNADVTERCEQPITVRTYAEPERVTLVVVNLSPWSAETHVTLDLPQSVILEPLVGGEAKLSEPPPTKTLPAGIQTWSLSLAPYAIEAVRIAAPGLKVTSIKVDVNEAAKNELAARIADLTNRDLTAPRLYQRITNPSFEPLGGAGPIPGWQISGAAATGELDATTPQEGKTCLYFQGKGQFAALDCDNFSTPETGQLAMTVWVRGQNTTPQSELRMLFESQGPGQPYRRSAIVGGVNPGAQAVSSQWQSYAILVDDLPLESGRQMRVRFELSGPGEIWLDDIKLYDLLFPLKFYRNARTEIVQLLQRIHAAKSALEAGQVADCVRLLEGYWPRFLETYTPLVQPAIAVDTSPAQQNSTSPANNNQETAPGLSERIKRFVPILR